MHDHHPRLEIAGRQVADDHPALVIAEIGVNHDGRLDRALALVEAARRCGADAVKLQVFSARRLMHASCRPAAYQAAAGVDDPVAMLRRCELSDAELEQVVVAARAAGLIPLATPFSPEDVERIALLGLSAVKLASPDLVNPLLLDAAGALGVPIIASCGAATLDEIDWAAKRLSALGASFALLHCVSAYPTPPCEARIARISELRRRFGVVVGYSDHTPSLAAGGLAVAAGARIVEKHLTHDRRAPGPDHAASADPRMFRSYVRRLRQAELLIGAAGGDPLPALEEDVRSLSRQSLVARRDLPAGNVIGRDDLTCQRPGTGIPARLLDRVAGARTIRHIAAGAMLDPGDLHLPARAEASAPARAA